MKQLFFLLLLVLGSTAAQAQAGYLTIINYTDCMITMSVRSHGDGGSCATVQSDTYDLYPSGIAFLSPTSSGPFGYPPGYAPLSRKPGMPSNSAITAAAVLAEQISETLIAALKPHGVLKGFATVKEIRCMPPGL